MQNYASHQSLIGDGDISKIQVSGQVPDTSFVGEVQNLNLINASGPMAQAPQSLVKNQLFNY